MALMNLLEKFWNKVEVDDKKRMDAQTPTPNIKEITDIPYIDDGKWQHKLDVYYKEGTNSKQPVIVDIHGGGFMYGNKELNKHYNLVLANYGYTVISINYTLVPEGTIDNQIRECIAAFKWIKENAHKFFGDPENIFLTGDSAGGFLATHTAIINSSETLRKIYGAVDSGLSFNAVGLTSPVCYIRARNFTKLYYNTVLGKDSRNKEFYNYVNLDDIINKGKMPPTFIVTSSGDTPARKQSRKAYALLKTNNIECEIMDWEKTDGVNLPHVFSVCDPYSKTGVAAIEKMLGFFNSHIIVHK